MKKHRPLILVSGLLLVGVLLVIFLQPFPASMRWARSLEVSEVERIEMVTMGAKEERYRLFERDEFEWIVQLVNSSKGRRVPNPEPIAGGSIVLYITLQDGTRHKVGNNGNIYLEIDGDSYLPGYEWLSAWDTEYGLKRGNHEVPEGFVY